MLVKSCLMKIFNSDFMVDITSEYVPNKINIQAPDIPGRIIALIAIKHEKNKYSPFSESDFKLGLNWLIMNENNNPKTKYSNKLTLGFLTFLYINITLDNIIPEKNAHNGIE